MCLSGLFVNEGSGLCDPVVLKVTPVPMHRITAHSSNMVVRAQCGTGEALQNNAESAGRAVEMARLKPDTIRIGYPATIIRCVDGSNEVLPASARWIEAIGETVESSDGHTFLPCRSTIDAQISARSRWSTRSGSFKCTAPATSRAA